MKYQSEMQYLKKNIINDDDFYTSVKDMLEKIRKFIPENNVLAELDNKDHVTYYTAEQIVNMVEDLADGLISSLLEGLNVAIISENSVKYIVTELAITSGLGVFIPIDKNLNEELMAEYLKKVPVDVIFCDSHLIEKIKHVMTKLEEPDKKLIVVIDKKIAGYFYFNDLLEMGKKNHGSFMSKNLDLNATCKIVFTYDNGDVLRAIEYSNKSIVENIKKLLNSAVFKEDESNTSFSVLPMNNPAEISTHILPRLATGRLTYINNNTRTVISNIKICKPNIIVLLPYMIKAVYKEIWAIAKRTETLKKLKFRIKLSNFAKSVGLNFKSKFFSDFLEILGGNLHYIVCFGSNISPSIVNFFKDLGISVITGYGLAECGPLISFNLDNGSDIGYLGAACPGIDVKVVDQDVSGIGQLAIKSESLFSGYYKEKRATQRAFDEEGFFLTEDCVRLDGNNIILVGKNKNKIKLPNGKNIFPEEIEALIESDMLYVTESVVFISERNNMNILCARLFIKDATDFDKDTVVADIENINLKLSLYKQIDFIQIVHKEFVKNDFHAIRRDLMPSKVTEEDGITIK